MARPLTLDPDRLFPADPATRAIARALYAEVASLPIVSPHGHTDARWFADNAPWQDATSLLLAPDHYIYRMLYSQGVDLDALAIPRRDGVPATDQRAAWQRMFDYYVFADRDPVEHLPAHAKGLLGPQTPALRAALTATLKDVLKRL